MQSLIFIIWHHENVRILSTRIKK